MLFLKLPPFYKIEFEGRSTKNSKQTFDQNNANKSKLKNITYKIVSNNIFQRLTLNCGDNIESKKKKERIVC